MSHTVVGVFDTSVEAQTALQQLVSSGFDRQTIDIKPRTEKSTTDGADDSDDDSISNFFRNLFGSDDKSDRYSKYARTIGSVVTVHARSAQEAEKAADILDDNGAVDLDERASGYVAGTAGATDTSYRDTSLTSHQDTSLTSDRDTSLTSDRDTPSEGTTIPVIEEEMHVGKRTVETGGVRVRSRIVERPVEEHLRLREEHVHIERNPANRPATDADFANFKEGDVELTERAEVPVVDKQTRVVEEVRISKDVEEHDEAIRGTIRKTDVDIDQLSEEELRRHRSGGDPSNQL